jgi:hypothetical protein
MDDEIQWYRGWRRLVNPDLWLVRVMSAIWGVLIWEWWIPFVRGWF